MENSIYFSYPIYGAMLLLLLSTFAFARDVKGSYGWIDIGSFKLQPAEFAKFATNMALAKIPQYTGYTDAGSANQNHFFDSSRCSHEELFFYKMIQGQRLSSGIHFCIIPWRTFRKYIIASDFLTIVLFVLTLLLYKACCSELSGVLRYCFFPYRKTRKISLSL